MELCDWCGNPLPAGARFCPTCGAPVGPLEADTGELAVAVAGQAGITERKVVTVLFADVVRSTELAAMLDPERFSEVMAAFFQMVERELTSLRGRTEKFVGDAVLAVFGVPHAHEDDALRAVRAALFIRDRTARLGERLDLPVPLRVRVGINSGPVAAGPEATGWSGTSIRPLISGATVNLAARLEQAAEAGEILVGETTRQLVRHMVAFGEERDVAAKGFGGPVHGWPVKGLGPRSHRRTIPLVGRRGELGILEQTFDRVRASGHACLATVLGEPGIGKSRLVDEFLVQLPSDVRVLQGRSGEFEEDPAFAPIAEMLRRELGLDRDASDEEFRERLEDVVAGCCDASEVEQTAARLGIALGLTEPSREGRRYRAAELRAGFLSFLQGMVRSGGPVVIVFEDLHVARQGLLDVLDQLLEGARDLPVMVVAVARDSLLETRPTWGSHPDSVSLRLEPLPPDEAQELAHVAAESLDDATAARIASNTGGNPFFIVETTGMMLDEHAEHTQGAPHSHLLPPTVQAVVASRIDHLPDDARDLFRRASVFSMLSFLESELQLVGAAPDRAVLATLEEAELLVHDHDRPDEWRFRHELLRDVAYESLPKRERVRLHVGIVDRMEEAGTIERHPQGVAWHLEHAAAAALDLNPHDRSLAERAVDALAYAGDVARWRIESRTAIDLYDRALALAGDEDTWGGREARILSTRGEAMYWLGRFDDAAASLSRALEIGTDDVWTVAHASRFLGDIELNVRANPDRAAVLFDRALEAATELDDPWAEARALLMGAWVPYWRGEYETTRSMFERALDLARTNPEGDRWAQARALTSLTSVISPVGDEHEALGLAREALELGRAMRDPFTIAVAQQAVANSFRRMLDLDEAERYADQSYRTFHDLGARWEEASALSDRGTIRRLLGDLDGAEQDLRNAIRMSRELGERTMLTWTVDRLVLVLVMRGQFARARAELTDAVTSVDPDDPTFSDSFLASDVLLLLVEGDLGTARDRAQNLLDVVRADGRRNEIATTTWWVARLFGADEVGGEDVAEEARATLERAGWVQFVQEPELVLRALGREAEVDVVGRGSA
ncbi:MAG TPA: adenylate/guanylate cyclase domain-containing protein [Actinomycetota bacterium]